MGTNGMSDEINLLDFGTNDKGEYVNLVEEEKRLKDISDKEFQEWLDNHHDPLVKIAYGNMLSYEKLQLTHNELKEELEWVAYQKVYHYGNMEKGLYIYTLFNGNAWGFVFENDKHIMVNGNWVYSKKEVEDILFGKEAIQFNALAVRVYDLKGNHITEYGRNNENIDDDIRQKVVINEWQMNKYGNNRMNSGKKIKYFYEVELSLPKLIEYWGESEI